MQTTTPDKPTQLSKDIQEMEAAVLRQYLPSLINLLESCVEDVADQCFSEMLICNTVYKQIVFSQDYKADKARKLVMEVICRSANQSSEWFHVFCAILKAENTFNELILQMEQTLEERERDNRQVSSQDTIQDTIQPQETTQHSENYRPYTRKLSKKDSGYQDSIADNDFQLEGITEENEDCCCVPIHSSTPIPFSQQAQDSGVWMAAPSQTSTVDLAQETSSSSHSTAIVMHHPSTPWKRKFDDFNLKLRSLHYDMKRHEATEMSLREKISILENELSIAKKAKEDVEELMELRCTEIESLKTEKQALLDSLNTYTEGSTDTADWESKLIMENKMNIQKLESEKDTLQTMLLNEQQLASELMAQIRKLEKESDKEVEALKRQVSHETRGRLAAEGHNSVCTALCLILILCIAMLALELFYRQGDSSQCWLNAGGPHYHFS